MLKPIASLKGKTVIGISILLCLCGSCAPASSSPTNYLAAFSQVSNYYDGHTWSPNGQWLVSESTDANVLSLFSSKGQLVKNLTLGCELGGGIQDVSWLPNGSLSCMRADDPQRKLDVFTIDASGLATHITTINVPTPPSAIVYAFQWNPRHDWLAVLADATPGSGSPALYVVNANGQQMSLSMSIDAVTLAWSPGGVMLALPLHDGHITLLTVQQSKPETLSAKIVRELDAGASDIGNLAWSPSGRWLVCRHASYNSEEYLFLYATDGSGKQVKLTSSNTDGQLDDPAWSPDGKRIILSSIALSQSNLMSLDIERLLKDKGVME